MTPSAYIAAHGTTRWHTNHRVPAQTLADHSAGVAAFLLWLDEDVPLRVIYEALHHDDGEGIVGDIPGPAKRAHEPLAYEYEGAETTARIKLGVPRARLSDEEALLLKLADRLDAYAWAATMAPEYVRGKPEWEDEARGILKLADRLGKSGPVGDFMEGLHDGR